MIASGIYAIRCLPNGKAYVGSAVSIARRWRAHKQALRQCRHHSEHLQRAWNKYGEDAFHFEVLETVRKEELISVEQRYIDVMAACDASRGFNIAPIAGNTLGVKYGPMSKDHKAKISAAHKGKVHSAEHRANSSAAQKGKTSPNKGKVATAGTRLKMSVAKKGKKLSAKHIAKLVAAHTGKKRSAEACANMSAARKGVPATARQMTGILGTAQRRRKFSEQQVAEIRRRCELNQRIAEIAAEFGCNQGTIYRIKNNERQAYL